MPDYIVLIKQVPDISQITDNAFDQERGTLIRSRLTPVVNKLDAQALALAHRLKVISGDTDSKIVALTMGPPMAEEVLRYALARCADVAVLLTDNTLSGADTFATANPLAQAIKKIATEVLRDDKDYYIICGMQSTDGDTAQVPPQIAEHLQIPCVAYVTDAELVDGKFQFTKIITGGSQTVIPRSKPAVVTVASYEYPIFPTFARTRWANKTDITRLSAEDIQATQIGAKGSKTSVIRIFPPGKSDRKCHRVDSIDELAAVILTSFEKTEAETDQDKAIRVSYILPSRREDIFDRSFEALEKDREGYKYLCQRLKEMEVKDLTCISQGLKEKLITESDGRFHTRSLEDMLKGLTLTQPSYNGGVWVVAEHQQGKICPASFELIGKARQLADSLETQAGAVLAGYNNTDQEIEELIYAGADEVYLLEHKLLAEFDPWAYRKVIADCIKRHRPQIVLFAATAQGRILAPMVAYRCDCGLTADCTGLDIADISRQGLIGILIQTRPALGGNVMATICTKNSRCQMATVRPGVIKAPIPDKSRKGNIIREPVELSDEDISLQIIKSEKGRGQAKFESEIVVSGGKGMQNRDNYEKLIGLLCRALSERLNTSVEKGASRAAVERGFADRIYQIGQTGTSIGPKLYIAVGISGAIQHMIGITNAQTIIAINSDPDAPIFKQCDYYIVGTAEQIIPELAKSLRR